MPTIEELKMELAKISTTIAELPVWDAKKTKKGKCEHHYHYNKEEVEVMLRPTIGNTMERTECKEHFEQTVNEQRRELEKKVKSLQERINFQEKLSKVTRFAQMKDLVAAVRAIINREKKRGYGERHQFSQDELEKGKELLEMLCKVRPKSSPFLDRGVAVNSDLYLSGTIQEHQYRSREPGITLTALDQDEHYKSISRVRLTIGEAERLRNLLVECIEHVRIAKMINDLEENMEIKVSEKEERYSDE